MITVKDFNDYLKEMKAKPELTFEDQMAIGIKFKQLPLKAKNWDSLIKVLGLNTTKDAFRKKVSRYLKSHPELVPNEVEGEIYANDFIEQQKVRDWYNAYRRNIREETRIQNLKDEIEKASNKFSKIKFEEWVRHPYKVDDKYEGETEAVLMLSDLHIGVECDNCYNKYDYGIAAHRLGVLAGNVVKYCDRNHVKKLNVLNLGDMIHGIIHTNARIEAQMDVAEQIILAGELLSQFLALIIKAAPEVTYRSVFDNHSRAIADKNEHIEKEQFSRVIDWMIRERLKDTPIKFINDNIDGGVGKLDLLNGSRIIFAHGHQDSINSSWQNFIGMTKEWVDYIMLAHYHNPKEKAYNGSIVFVNGSIVGTEQYAFGRRLFSEPTQKLLIFNNTKTYQDINISLKVAD